MTRPFISETQVSLLCQTLHSSVCLKEMFSVSLVAILPINNYKQPGHTTDLTLQDMMYKIQWIKVDNEGWVSLLDLSLICCGGVRGRAHGSGAHHKKGAAHSRAQLAVLYCHVDQWGLLKQLS